MAIKAVRSLIDIVMRQRNTLWVLFRLNAAAPNAQPEIPTNNESILQNKW